MANTKPECDRELAWVRRLREIGEEADEIAASIHPSAWTEVLQPLRERWRKGVQEGGEEE